MSDEQRLWIDLGLWVLVALVAAAVLWRLRNPAKPLDPDPRDPPDRFLRGGR